MSVVKESLKLSKNVELEEGNVREEMEKLVFVLNRNLDLELEWIDLIPKNLNEALILVSAKKKDEKRLKKRLVAKFKNFMSIF
jgi:hypothetical protein